MADSIRERIIQAVKAEMEAITVGAGFNQTVGKAYRGHESPIQVDEDFAVIIFDRGGANKRHLRGAYENRMNLELRPVHREDDDAKRLAALNAFGGDIQKKIVTDETHGGLAKKTNLITNTVSTGEPVDPLASQGINIEILYRVERADPFVNTEI